jgi:hypothetical protein
MVNEIEAMDCVLARLRSPPSVFRSVSIVREFHFVGRNKAEALVKSATFGGRAQNKAIKTLFARPGDDALDQKRGASPRHSGSVNTFRMMAWRPSEITASPFGLVRKWAKDVEAEHRRLR